MAASCSWADIRLDAHSDSTAVTASVATMTTSESQIDVYDPLVKGPELGTYYATMHFITSGQWAVAIRFQRDSTKKLERMDWMQEVFPARGEQN